MVARKAAVVATLGFHLAGCCLQSPKAANVPRPTPGPVRILVRNPRALPPVDATSRDRATRGAEDVVAEAVRAASTANPRAELEALVARVNAGTLDRARRGPYLGAIVANNPRELVLYPPAAVADGNRNAAGGYVDLLRGLERLERPRDRSRPAIVMERTVYYAERGAPEGTRGQDTKALADRNRGWALDHVLYDKALARLSAPPGTGVTIAHLDTGYSDHCEFTSAAGTTPLDPASGYDFFAGKADPRDPLIPNDGILTHGGHGTKTATVIISPHTSRCTASPYELRGIAPAATLVPVRVTNGIVIGLPPIAEGAIGAGLFDARILGLSNGVLHASDPASSWVKKQADVISVSMGGQCRDGDWQTNLLRCSLRRAERLGVIVVAAAGQYPHHSSLMMFGKKPVCFPGRFPGTVSVAGSTILAKPWDESGRGPEATIAAPSEWVYRGEKNGTADAWGFGPGTSFGTAMTAGLAALWVQRWGGGGKLRADYGPTLTTAFRLSAQKAVRQPAAVCADLPSSATYKADCSAEAWPGEDWGPGIVDADALLGNPPPSPQAVCAWIAAHRPDEAAVFCTAGAPRPVEETDCSVPSGEEGSDAR